MGKVRTLKDPNAKGLRVLRFWNHDVLTNRDGVCLTILNACEGVED